MNTTTTPTDIQSLIGQMVSSEYIQAERERELLDAAAEDFEGYDEWSEDVENLHVINGQLRHKPTPKRGPFIAGIEI